MTKRQPKPPPDEALTQAHALDNIGHVLKAGTARAEAAWSVIDYVREEVGRQGHDVTQLDGIARVGWMLNAWSYALGHSQRVDLPDSIDMRNIGKLVEPVKNSRGLRRLNVRVRTATGFKNFAPHEEVPRLLDLLFEQRSRLTPIEFYKGFEEIHPFCDGNGRTGKILLNWLNGTLLEPVFPPADIFGYPIRNP